ncbi:MAG: DUF58 domain-containing protein [Planctomycetota bacterium]|jgi:uncharacterized protein (DUF58 family)
MAPSTADLDLLDPAFIARAQALRIVARRVAPAGRWAEQRSLDRGSGIEFRDYRPYAPGDDLRAIDWNIYLRLGRIVLRLFEELEDLPIYLVPDLSRSMWMEQPPRAHAALRTVVGLASIGLDQHDAVGIFPFGEQLDVAMRPRSGRSRLLEIASLLQTAADEAVTARRRTDLVTAIGQFRGLGLREGLAIVVSDFFDPAGAEAIVAELKRMRHRVLLVPIVRRDDAEPTIEGDCRLRDCETGATYDVSITTDVRTRYAAAYERHMSTLKGFCRRRQGGFMPIDAEQDVLEQLSRMFEGGRYEA